jgi:hypothetical protein
MTTLCNAFATEDEAHAAVDRLLAAGIPGAEIRLLTGEPVRDHRNAPVGRFAGEGRDEPVGSFADVPRSSRDDMGSFAGDPEQQRRGGFGDLDRDTVTSYRDGVRRVHVVSHRNLKKMLVDAGLDDAAADADVEALHHGRVLVLLTASSLTPEAVALALDAASWTPAL